MPRPSRPKRKPSTGETTLRIVGGSFGGRKLKFAGDKRVRPMKDRTREALFNLLGPDVEGTFVIDLFGGTGALALEALSRGASGAVIVEQHLPTARVVRENIALLEVSSIVSVIIADTFIWARREPELSLAQPWLVFCSPPYRFFTERPQEMCELIAGFLQRAPVKSLFAVEATRDFDFSLLPCAEKWDVRSYPPAVVAVLQVDEG